MLIIANLVLSVLCLFLLLAAVAASMKNTVVQNKLEEEEEISQELILQKKNLELRLEEVTRERDGLRSRYSN